MRRLTTLLLIVICSTLETYSQIGNKGVPIIKNYTYEAYSAGTQNWDMLQDDQGVMLFANNYGLLEFNGVEWDLSIQMPNKTVVRSLMKSKEGVIYLGAQNDLGFIKRNEAGQKSFVSLLSLIPERAKSFSDVWEIFETTSGIYFITHNAVFWYKEDEIIVIEPYKYLRNYSRVGDVVYVQDDDFDIYRVLDDGLIKIIEGHEIDNSDVVAMYQGQSDDIMLVSGHGGIFPYRDHKLRLDLKITNQFLEKDKIYSFQQLRGGYMAIGTVGSGVLIMDQDYLPVQVLSKKNGLQSNTILAMGTDLVGNLWIAGDVGIDYVEIASSFNKINENFNLEGAVYATIHMNEMLYVATNVGLFYTPWREKENPLQPVLNFKKVKGVLGQVWDLGSVDGILYVCHESGFFRMENETPIRIGNHRGIWNISRFAKDSPYYLQGSYSGMHLLELVNGVLEYRWKIADFDETSRIIETDPDGNIWMAHGYKGMYRLRLNDKLDRVVFSKLYVKENGFPTSLFINLFKVKDKILFGTEYGTYEYDLVNDSMVVDPYYLRIFGNKEHIRLLKEDKGGDLWFVKGDDMNDQIGVVDFYENDKYEIIKAPMQKLHRQMNPGFENINLENDKAILFGTKGGLVVYDRSQYRNYEKQFNATLSKVKLIHSDSLIYGQSSIDEQGEMHDHVGKVKLSSDHNSLSFSYSSNQYEDTKGIRYSFYLDGFDESWRNPVKSHIISYTNLPGGEYTFHVKAINIYDTESKEAQYAFIVLPPWYLSMMAKFIYVILGSVLFWMLFKLFNVKVEKAQRKERLTQLLILRKNRAQFKKEKMSAEQELVLLRNQKLEDEIAISNSKMEILDTELASSIMAITQKKEVLSKVSDDLGQLLKKAKDSNKKLIQRVIRLINQDIDTEEDWHQFKIHFDKVHGNFLERLKSDFPDVKGKDLQLAAYLRLNMSSKEISSMMNITVRSVEGCRYRLRKNLGLESSVNLSEFVLRY